MAPSATLLPQEPHPRDRFEEPRPRFEELEKRGSQSHRERPHPTLLRTEGPVCSFPMKTVQRLLKKTFTDFASKISHTFSPTNACFLGLPDWGWGKDLGGRMSGDSFMPIH